MPLVGEAWQNYFRIADNAVTTIRPNNLSSLIDNIVTG
jgi:hypothetical protein